MTIDAACRAGRLIFLMAALALAWGLLDFVETVLSYRLYMAH